MLVKADVKFKRVSDTAKLPQYATDGSSGMDVFADEEVIIVAGALSAKVRLGIAGECPQGMELQARSRSGIASKTGIRVSTGLGTIDSDYRGEICMILDNLGKEHYHIKKGDKIGQLVLCPVFRANIKEVEQLSDTKRGAGGFGSTGAR